MSGSGKARNLRELYVSSKKLLTTGKGIQCPIVKSFPTFGFSKLEADKWLQVSNLQYVPPASSLPSNLCRHVGGRSSLALQQLVLSSPDASQMLHTTSSSSKELRAHCQFLSDPGIPGVRSMGPGFSKSLTRPVADFTDVTLADEDTDSILADNDNRAI